MILLRAIPLFALPFIASSFVQQLYSLADLMIVGQFAGTESLAGINVSISVMTLITNLAVGFCVGGSVLIGQCVGAKQYDRLKQLIGNLFLLLTIGGLAVTAVLLLGMKPLLTVLQTPEEAWSEARNYLIICGIGVIFIYGYNAISAVLRGMGDSKRPFWVVVIACVLNVFLDLLMVSVLKLGAGGAAAATILSQLLSFLLCVLLLKKDGFVFDFHLSSFRYDRQSAHDIIKLGLPTALQNVVMSMSFLFQTAVSSSLGTAAIAATGSAGKLISLGIVPSIAIGNAVSAMVAQNVGAGQEKRALDTVKISIVMNYVVNTAVFVIIRVFETPILRLFTTDSQVLANGSLYLSTFAIDLLMVPVMGSLCALFNGCGHTAFSSGVHMFASVAVRVPLCWLFAIVLGFGVKGVGMGAPTASAIASVICVVCYFTGRWRKGTPFDNSSFSQRD